MSDTPITELASRPAVIERFLDSYHGWITANLGCAIEDAVRQCQRRVKSRFMSLARPRAVLSLQRG